MGWGAGYVKKRTGTVGVDLRCFSLNGRKGGRVLDQTFVPFVGEVGGGDFRMQTNMCLLDTE